MKGEIYMYSNLELAEKYIQENQEKALRRASQILGKQISHASFNGRIGGKNATYELNINDFDTAQDYVEAWFNSNLQRYEDEKHFGDSKSSVRIYNMLSDEFLRNYIGMYLARTYFRKQ